MKVPTRGAAVPLALHPSPCFFQNIKTTQAAPLMTLLGAGFSFCDASFAPVLEHSWPDHGKRHTSYQFLFSHSRFYLDFTIRKRNNFDIAGKVASKRKLRNLTRSSHWVKIRRGSDEV